MPVFSSVYYYAGILNYTSGVVIWDLDWVETSPGIPPYIDNTGLPPEQVGIVFTNPEIAGGASGTATITATVDGIPALAPITAFVPAPVVPTVPTMFVPNDGLRTLTYMAEYLADVPDIQIINMSSLDPALVSPDFVLSNNDFDVTFSDYSATQSGYPNSESDISTVFEVVVGENNISVGVVKNFADPNEPNGGTTDYITYTYGGFLDSGGTITPGLPTFTQGDVIGVVSTIQPGGYGDTYLRFYKNGVLVYASNLILSLYATNAMITYAPPIVVMCSFFDYRFSQVFPGSTSLNWTEHPEYRFRVFVDEVWNTPIVLTFNPASVTTLDQLTNSITAQLPPDFSCFLLDQSGESGFETHLIIQRTNGTFAIIDNDGTEYPAIGYNYGVLDYSALYAETDNNSYPLSPFGELLPFGECLVPPPPPPPTTYTYYSSIQIRNGFDGDTGIAGYIGQSNPFVSSFEIEASQLLQTYPSTAMSKLLLTTSIVNGAYWSVGAGNANGPSGSVGPTLDTYFDFTTTPNEFFARDFYFPMEPGDKIWCIGTNFSGYGAPFTVDVMIGPDEFSGIHYQFFGNWQSDASGVSAIQCFNPPTPVLVDSGSSLFNVINTLDAAVNTVDIQIYLNVGQTLKAGTCNLPGAILNAGDSYVRLLNSADVTVASNDDFIGFASYFEYTSVAAGLYTFKVGGFDMEAAEGTAVWEVYSF